MSYNPTRAKKENIFSNEKPDFIEHDSSKRNLKSIIIVLKQLL
jgi:hypothetical protein